MFKYECMGANQKSFYKVQCKYKCYIISIKLRHWYDKIIIVQYQHWMFDDSGSITNLSLVLFTHIIGHSQICHGSPMIYISKHAISNPSNCSQWLQIQQKTNEPLIKNIFHTFDMIGCRILFHEKTIPFVW
jgi:hypothetical protein